MEGRVLNLPALFIALLFFLLVAFGVFELIRSAKCFTGKNAAEGFVCLILVVIIAATFISIFPK